VFRVAIDARPAVSAGMTGIGHYTRELILRLPRADPETTYVAWYLNAGRLLRPWRWNRRLLPGPPNLQERWTPFPSAWFERTSLRWELPRLEWLTRFDVLFAPNFVPPPSRTRCLVLTIHDLAFRLHPETAPQATRRWLTRLDRAISQAAEIVVVSDSTRRDLLDLYPVDAGRVTVIHHGIDPERFRPAPPHEVARVRRRYGIDGPYVVFLGGLDPRKNLPALLAAWSLLPDDRRPTMVLAGGSVPWNPEGRIQLEEALGRLPQRRRRQIVLTGYVGHRDKVALLTGAEGLVFPSLYEGFGLPIVEAMAVGAPVLTSTASAMPEVAQDAAVLVDPRSEEAIAEGLDRLLGDEDLRTRLREAGRERVRGLSWDDAARRHVEVLHRAARR
jgi:glycosyltransferase involved in cell wall biosynthesis